MSSQAGTYGGKAQYDPTWNPYTNNNGNDQVIPIEEGDNHTPDRVSSSGENTAVSSAASATQKPDKNQSESPRRDEEELEEYEDPRESLATIPTAQKKERAEDGEAHDQVPEMAPIKTAKQQQQQQRPTLANNQGRSSQGSIYHSLTQRWTSEKKENKQGGHEEEMEEIQRLLTQMFGKERREHSEEEKTRHVGLVWDHLTVKGAGVGAAVQGTVATPYHKLKTLFTKGPKAMKSKPPVRNIIDDFTGCLKPGEMCLVLGKPGSGCSTFLKVMANQRSGYEDVEGEVTYGGTDHKTMEKNYRGDIIYNPEDDLHYATLKVKDTLGFAIACRIPGKESREEGESRKQYADKFLKIVTKLFWIEHTLDVKVGNELIRGVSGGERKRVSIAEAMITRASSQFYDNSTKGLDASSAREYVEALRVLTNMTSICTMAALYQVGESLYELFDKVLVIEGGKCAYFGPTEKAAEYFKDMGFKRGDRWTTADFLTSVFDEHERQIEDGAEKKIPRNADDFAKHFRESKQAQENAEEVEEFHGELKKIVSTRHHNQTKHSKKKNYTISYWQQVVALTRRQFLVILGDPQSFLGKWGAILFQSLIVGSLFYALPKTTAGVFQRGGVIFYMLLFNSLLALAELTAVFQSRPILLKHKSFSFYRPSAYAIAQTLMDIPLVFVQVTIFDVVVYFMADLQRTPSQFFISLLILFTITMTIYSMFRAAGALLPSLDAATRITGVLIQALIVYTGYLIPASSMRVWFAWLRRADPIAYAFEALMVNEFYNLEIQCVPPFLVPEGPGTSVQYQSCTLQGSTPGSDVVNGENYVYTQYSYRHDHLWRNWGIVCAFFLGFVVLTMIGMEIQKPNKGGAAQTIFKQGQAPASVAAALEKGSTPEDEESGSKSGDTLNEKEGDKENSDNQEQKGVAKNTTIFTWRNVNYHIPTKNDTKTLLKDQQGYVRPGKLTALMGSSGAGKTTLLNVLAQRIEFGHVEGEFLIDGQKLPKSFQRASGYAEQMDIHEPTATVLEALQFSAQLRQPREVPYKEKMQYVEEVLDIMEMRDLAGAIIGVPGEGLDPESRKRLTIAVELASKPELLLFLDEPTSGLDSQAAFNITRLLKKLAANGQAILCTIHQPSAILFEHFDELILLESGGRTVYHGELGHDSKTLTKYFENNGADKCPHNTNPAEYMLEAIGAGNPDYKGKDWGDVWDESDERKSRSEEIEKMISEKKDHGDKGKVTDDREFAMPFFTQLKAVMFRRFTTIWRTPDYVVGMMMLHIVTGLFNGFTFYNIGETQIDMQSRLFSIFLVLTIAPPLIQQLQPKFIEFRSLFKSREGQSRIYSWWAFAISATLVELPYRVVAGTLYWCCWYWPVFRSTSVTATYPAAVVWMFLILFEIFYTTFGQMIAALAPNELLASLLVPVFFTFVISFCGVVVPAMALPYFWRSWMYYLTPFHYLLEGLLGLVIHNEPIRCATKELAIFPPPPGQTCQQYAGAYAMQSGGYVETQPNGFCGLCQYANGDAYGRSFNVYYTHLWRDYGFFWAYVLFNFAVVFFFSWLYLGGAKKFNLLDKIKNRKQKGNKVARQQENVKGGQKMNGNV